MSILSMTGYGRSDVQHGAGTLTVEVRSVNNRYLDVQVKTPRSLAILEPRIKKAVQDGFARGRFDVFVSRSGAEAGAVRFTADFELAAQYIGMLRELKTRFSLPGDVDLPLIAGLPDIIAREEIKEDTEALWQSLSRGIAGALGDLRTMRAEEGAALVRDMSARLAIIEGAARDIEAALPAAVEQARRRIEESLARILKETPDPLRVAQEIAVLAERADVTEELTRLASHISQFRAMVAKSGEAVGRKLDFLLQEMGREANTIASKAANADVSLLTVTIKAELEKIREQAQNIE